MASMDYENENGTRYEEEILVTSMIEVPHRDPIDVMIVPVIDHVDQHLLMGMFMLTAVVLPKEIPVMPPKMTVLLIQAQIYL